MSISFSYIIPCCVKRNLHTLLLMSFNDYFCVLHISTGPSRPEGSRGESLVKNLKQPTVLRPCEPLPFRVVVGFRHIACYYCSYISIYGYLGQKLSIRCTLIEKRLRLCVMMTYAIPTSIYDDVGICEDVEIKYRPCVICKSSK